MTTFERLASLDKRTLSCLRGDIERIRRTEVSNMSSIIIANTEVYSAYLNGLDVLLKLLCELEHYDMNYMDDIAISFNRITEDNKPLSTEDTKFIENEEVSKRWV